MRHKKSFNHLSRTASHRKAMLSNMAASLILHKKIKTTTAKAKALRIYVEPLITKSKDDSTHSRRVVFSYLQSNEAVTELFREVSPKIADRPGGYTRILKTGARIGDNADMCIIELVDYNENLLSAKLDSKSAAGHRKRRSGGKKKTEETQSIVATSSETASAKPEKKEAKKSETVVYDNTSEDKNTADTSEEKESE
jgi:large subunit ribosomal protein L17